MSAALTLSARTVRAADQLDNPSISSTRQRTGSACQICRHPSPRWRALLAR
jgi:hypothetical protein